MSFNEELIKYLSLLPEEGGLVFQDESILFSIKGELVMTLTTDDISLFGESFQNHFIQSSDDVYFNKMIQFSSFLHAFEGKFRLNHFGISYWTPSLEKEVEKIKQLAGGQLSLYEDLEHEEGQRWLFIGENSTPPFFEFVINLTEDIKDDIWRPHFQIDLDVDLPYEELMPFVHRYFGMDFVQFNIAFPKPGVILLMGLLANYGNCKIALGLRPKIKMSLPWGSLKLISGRQSES